MRTKGWVLAGAITAALALPAGAQAAPKTVSCSASSLATVGSLLAAKCTTPPVTCIGPCVLTGSVTSKAAVPVGRVGGRLDARSSTSVVLSAGCAANASTCTAVSGEVRPGPGSYSGACAWSEPSLLWVLTNVTCTVTAVDCAQELSDAGLPPPANPNYVVGTNGADSFESTDANDVFCGLGGGDTTNSVGTGDVFLGGSGNDLAMGMDGGTFNGGEGLDIVRGMGGGTFNGGAGNDAILFMDGGTFNGGEGTDVVYNYVSGTCTDVETGC